MGILVVSGFSGAGKSTCLHALEDVGYYCVDNLPVPLVPDLVEVLRDAHRRLAVGIDARDAEYLAQFPEVRAALEAEGHSVEILFVEASVPVLVRRYSETRRRHPMGELPGAIERESRLLSALRESAGATIDSSELTGRQLRQLVRDRHGGSGTLRIVLMSFGYRNALPSEADLVWDVRFLPNPQENRELRPLTGLHEPVSRFVLEQEGTSEVLDMVERWLRYTVPRITREGRSYLTVAIGCTGGQHRSVSIVQALHKRLMARNLLGTPAPDLVVRHRDVGRDA